VALLSHTNGVFAGAVAHVTCEADQPAVLRRISSGTPTAPEEEYSRIVAAITPESCGRSRTSWNLMSMSRRVPSTLPLPTSMYRLPL
jgi:hypothetical protein